MSMYQASYKREKQKLGESEVPMLEMSEELIELISTYLVNFYLNTSKSSHELLLETM